MKLYTEEQVHKIIELAEFGRHITYGELLDEFTPIELPSNDEIEKWAHNKYHEVEDSRWFEPLQVGAKWMRDTLTNGINNETEQY